MLQQCESGLRRSKLRMRLRLKLLKIRWNWLLHCMRKPMPSTGGTGLDGIHVILIIVAVIVNVYGKRYLFDDLFDRRSLICRASSQNR